ncbi:hypothetical protein H8356DRAFT_1315472 [Neocallimastix lanati (nom. inval.)]|nr:hypothetical protein H8356DRAFT_1315472 [Neocallimastix sp. JGI-2020a]
MVSISLSNEMGSVVTENSPTPVEASPARRQNTRDKKTTSAPEKPATSKPKPNAVPEANNISHSSVKNVGTRPSNKSNYFKDSRTSSNNSTPKPALLMQDGSE